MREICDRVKAGVGEILADWDGLVREEPWFSLPADQRIDDLPEVVIGLAEAALCVPAVEEKTRQNVEAAVEHGENRRRHGIPEHLILTEYSLLRRAIWRFLVRHFHPSDLLTEAMLRLDTAIGVASNAAMWGYHREEIEAIGNWDESVERIIRTSPLLAHSALHAHSARR
jgi:hypothetical protein